MRLSVYAIGRMKAGSEADLAARYFDRLKKSGPTIGLELGNVTELVESTAGRAIERKADEAARLSERLAPAASIIILDERGKAMGSEPFARHLAQLRDAGRREVALLIGGPDGFDEGFRSRAELVISFGSMTWPHQLVRVMLAEQLYRATTILSGHPYHRA